MTYISDLIESYVVRVFTTTRCKKIRKEKLRYKLEYNRYKQILKWRFNKCNKPHNDEWNNRCEMNKLWHSNLLE